MKPYSFISERSNQAGEFFKQSVPHEEVLYLYCTYIQYIVFSSQFSLEYIWIKKLLTKQICDQLLFRNRITNTIAHTFEQFEFIRHLYMFWVSFGQSFQISNSNYILRQFPRTYFEERHLLIVVRYFRFYTFFDCIAIFIQACSINGKTQSSLNRHANSKY